MTKEFKTPEGFLLLEDVINSLPVETQRNIDARVNEMVLDYEFSKVKNVKNFGKSLKEFGAKLFVHLPDGKKIELHLPSHA